MNSPLPDLMIGRGVYLSAFFGPLKKIDWISLSPINQLATRLGAKNKATASVADFQARNGFMFQDFSDLLTK